MTEMVYGTVPVQSGDPVLPRWWRTIDKWTMSCILILFGIGLLLGLASSPPLAARNGLEPFHYVTRQAIFGGMAMIVMFIVSMMSPTLVRRLAVLGFLCAFVALAFLPVFGTDFGKGATRWYSLGFASVQPSEFLKPGFVVMAAWLLAASQQLGGPPGKTYSFVLTVMIVLMLALQPDFGQAALILFAWGVMYFVAGAPMLLLIVLAGLVVFGGTVAYTYSEHFARRIDGFLSPDLDPNTQLGYATNAIREGGFFGVGVGEGQVKWSLPDAHTDFIIAVAAEEYGLDLRLGHYRPLCRDCGALFAAFDERARRVHPSCGHGVGLHLWGAGDDQYGRCCSSVACERDDPAFCFLWWLVPDCGRDRCWHALGVHAQQAAGRDG